MSDQGEHHAGDHHAGGAAEQEQMGRRHVFVVNGAVEFLELIRELLQDERYNVTTTNFVPRTFDQVAALEPDLIIVDLVVGQQAGWDLLERLQVEAVTHDIPVLVTSTDGRLLERAQVDFARYGGQAFLVAPMDLEDLLADIQSLLGHP